LLKKLLSHSAIYGIAPQIPQVANILILPIITKDLTQMDYGVAGIIYSYLAALGAIHLLGLPMILSNGFFHHSKQYKWLWRQVHGFLSAWSLIYAFLVAVVIYFAVPEEAAENRWTIVLLHSIPIVLFNVTTEYGRLFFLLSKKPLPIALQVGIIGFITIALNLYLISGEKMGYMGWFWSRFVGSMLGFLFFFYPVYIKQKLLPIFNFKWRLIKEKLKIALPMVPHFYGAYLLSSSDRVVMSLLNVNTNKVGIYSLAGNFGNYFNAFADGSGMATSPFLSEYYKNLGKKAAFKIARDLIFLWQGGMIVFSFLVCLWFKEIFEFLINNADLQEAYPLAIIIIMGYNYRPLYSGFASKLFYFEKPGNIWKISFGSGVINIILNVIFIPIYGIEAAAISTFGSFLLMGIAGFFITDYRGLKDLNYYPFYWLGLICITTVIVYLLKDMYWLYKIALTLAVLTACIGLGVKYKAFLLSFDVKQWKKDPLTDKQANNE